MSARLAFVLLALALALGATLAFAADPPPLGLAAPTPSASAPPPAGSGAPTTWVSGTTPMPADQKVPARWLPPGASAPDTGPSDVIFPEQQLTLRFNHKLHVQGQHLACKSCHPGAITSDSSADSLIPRATVCDDCHLTDHSDLDVVKAGTGASGQCAFCHLGYRPGDGNRVASLVIPRPNMVFSHRKHAVRNIGCGQCHGEVQQLELATRDQMPRMRGCLGCHQMPDALARGDAKSACDTCHVRRTGGAEGGVIRTRFPSGKLEPPRWLHNAKHGPDFLERHKMVAGNDSAFCANCHKESFCVDCHDGRVRPRGVHPNDYLQMHPVEARMATQRCQSCHREQSFCLPCHLRSGVANESPTGDKVLGRFHPPKAIWTDLPRRPGHHADEAERNLNACVSCHTERDCASCHASTGMGGGGYNIHPAGFAAGCGVQLRRNPRPCYVCHQPGDQVLQSCR